MNILKNKLVMTCLKKQDLQRKYDLLKEESETIKETLQTLKDTPEIRNFIISLLGEGPRLSESSQLMADHPTKVIGEDGSEKIIPVDLESKYFDPSVDEWEIVGIEDNTDKYRIQIEAVKNRGYIGVATYTMDTFWTPWFSLTDKKDESI